MMCLPGRGTALRDLDYLSCTRVRSCLSNYRQNRLSYSFERSERRRTCCDGCGKYRSEMHYVLREQVYGGVIDCVAHQLLFTDLKGVFGHGCSHAVPLRVP